MISLLISGCIFLAFRNVCMVDIEEWRNSKKREERFLDMEQWAEENLRKSRGEKWWVWELAGGM